jgi:CRISPR-associated endonuclease/helicase Cas3
MITLHLRPHAEKQAAANPLNPDLQPLYHQMRTYDALADYDVVMNSYNTGAGKTVASLLHLFRLNGRNQNVLFIAPTNALIEQHAEDIEEFIEYYHLDFKVQRITAATIRQIDGHDRPGQVLHHLIRNYLKYDDTAVRRQPIILVTNPDIFYYALFAKYGQHDQRNLLEDFILRFDYLVIDEFHYYDSKQVANFLFAFALFDQFGYFGHEDHQRKVCLLSATPTQHVRGYLDDSLANRWIELSPLNEPPESANLPTVPALSPLELTLIPSELNDWLVGQRYQVRDWLQAGEDGAIISSSLWRVNTARRDLLAVLTDEQMKRITGPEPPEARKEAAAYPLILASPTVDIGYNFTKKGKERQNIDFLICDARFGDELLQRIGRAGRLLGKTETTRPSRAIALLPDKAVETLAVLNGQTLDRAAFNQHIRDCPDLPEKHRLTQYVSSHAVMECFWPIFKLGAVMPPAFHHELEALFERVRRLFAPRSQQTYQKLSGFYRNYQKRVAWYEQTKKEILFNQGTAMQAADWLFWLDANPHASRYDVPYIQTLLPGILEEEEQQRQLRAFVNSQITITKALFNFRDSFQGPTAVVHDPKHHLSSEKINSYDLFHLLRHYKLSPRFTRSQFTQQFGDTLLEGDFYFEIRGWREEKLQLAYSYRADDDQGAFAQKYCRAPVGLAGLRLQARQGGQIAHGALDSEIVQALYEHCLPVFIVSPDDIGPTLARLRGTAVWSQPLTIHFPGSITDEQYRIYFGKDAFFAHAELRTHISLKDRLDCEAIIL